MKYSFNELAQNIATRKFGGTTHGVADPLTTGYFYIWFDRLPAALPNYTSRGNSKISNLTDIKSILAATCTSVTPPGGTLTNVEFKGLGGTKWGVPGNIDYGDTVTLKFFEMNKTPIFDIIHGWFKLIRDYRTGVSDIIDGDNGEGFTKKTYGGLLFYWTTSPDGRTVEQYACYDGVYPMKDPQDLFSSDIETVGKLDIEIEFHLDTPWHEPWVLEKCQSLSNQFSSSLDTVKDYGEKQGS
jgi:hypothetical protein